MSWLMKLRSASLLLLLLGFLAVEARPPYQNDIPNGHRVTNPCDSGNLWPGVGHWSVDGGGERNAFGKDFFANNKTWTTALCQKDSDGDGRTNGQELGDPQCVWTKGANASRTEGITHPGVCEPVNSDACKRVNGKNIPCGSTSLRSALGLLCAMLLAAFLTR